MMMPMRGRRRRHECRGAEGDGGSDTQNGFLQHGAISFQELTVFRT
jgi:hypothetical protein